MIPICPLTPHKVRRLISSRIEDVIKHKTGLKSQLRYRMLDGPVLRPAPSHAHPDPSWLWKPVSCRRSGAPPRLYQPRKRRIYDLLPATLTSSRSPLRSAAFLGPRFQSPTIRPTALPRSARRAHGLYSCLSSPQDLPYAGVGSAHIRCTRAFL
ncbi:hypothetical protein VUR80DRAFT_720 [Thermomyces stellatus]